ncbi:MAG: CDP-glycerol glycerophosphotransferase family protein [Firmicutes bacterium]|nr:CDP-glycerol glycerophosphotransferase family protein [Bacillota bacterium]
MERIRLKKILAIAHQYGGANVLSPVIRELKYNYDIRIKTLGYNYSAVSFKKSRINFDDPRKIYDFYDDNSLMQTAKRIIKIEKPDLLLCGTSDGFNLEKALVLASRELQVCSIGILDNWTNLGLRFNEDDLGVDLIYLPDKLAVMDQFVKENILKFGVKNENIIVTGNPYFDEIINYQNVESSKSVRTELLLKDDDFIITFFSEPHSIDYGTDNSNLLFKGFTEKDVLKGIVYCIKKLNNYLSKNIVLLIKLHPKEDGKFILDEVENSMIRYRFLKEFDQRKLILASDIVIGIESIVLMESVILGKPTISFQPGLVGEDNLFSNLLGITKPIYRTDELLIYMKHLLNNWHATCEDKTRDIILDGLSSKRVIKIINGLLK